MKIYQQIFTENDCYKSGRYIVRPTGIMVHSTGANNPNLRRYLPGDELIGYNTNGNHWNMPGLDVAVHGFIGLDASGQVQIYQALPWNMRGWHAGGAANSTHISFEICEDGLDDPVYFSAVYAAAVDLCAFLAKEYSIDPSCIICHSEGAALGIASNHADVMHWFPRFGKTMDDFRADVRRALNGTETGNPVSEETEEIMTGEQIYNALIEYLDSQPTSDYAKESSLKGVSAKVFSDGDSDGLVDNPKAPLTREQFAVVLNRLGLLG